MTDPTARTLELLALLQTHRHWKGSELAERPEFSDIDRAEVLFRLGACRWSLSSISTAIALFDEALELAERSGLPPKPAPVATPAHSSAHAMPRPVAPGLSREDLRALQNALHDLTECRRLIEAAFAERG